MSDLSIDRAGHLGGTGDDLARLRQAAAQFETFFIKEIMKNGRQQQLGGMIDESPAMRQFRELLDDGLAERSAGRLGIAEMIVEDLAVRANLHGKG